MHVTLVLMEVKSIFFFLIKWGSLTIIWSIRKWQKFLFDCLFEVAVPLIQPSPYRPVLFKKRDSKPHAIFVLTKVIFYSFFFFLRVF